MANIEWQHCYGGSDHESIMDMIELTDGYILACSAYSNDGDIEGSGYHLGYDNYGNQTSDIWLLKLDFEGNIIWSRCYGGTRYDYPKRIFSSTDGGFIVFGEADSFDGDVVGNHSSGPDLRDIWVIKINSTGDLLWQQCFGGNWMENIESGVLDSGDGSYIIASTITGMNTGQIECNPVYLQDQVWLIKIRDTTVVNTINHEMPEINLKVYPNPANEYVLFENQSKTTGVISVTDIYSRPVAEVPVTGEKTVWDTRGVRPGVYLYRVELNKTTSTGKILIMR